MTAHADRRPVYSSTADLERMNPVQRAQQARWRIWLTGLDVLWVGVSCGLNAAESREIARADRVPGMARSQFDFVHAGVEYDLEVDTTATESMDSASGIADHLSTL